MSLEKKSTHVRLPSDLDHQLTVLAELADKDKAEIAATLLAKAIAGEWWQFQCGLEKMRALGIRGD
jgi:predicted transcriptional regulator